MGPLGASCFHTLSDGARDIAKPDWDTERFGMVCTSADSFANWKEAILKFCHNNTMCSFEVTQVVEKFSDHVDAIKRKKDK